MFDIPLFPKFKIIAPIYKGWSPDMKFYIETIDNKRMFLRIADIEEYERKKSEYNMMVRVYEHGIITSEPLRFGLCNYGKNCYSLSSWLDGEDAKTLIPLISETEQYILGVNSGETLRKIHSISAPEFIEPWNDWFYKKVQGRIDFYNENLLKSNNGDIIVRYLQDNKYLLDNRPQTFNHGDFNISNLMVMPDKLIGVIDFNSYNKTYGDPWWEFDPCLDGWGSQPSTYFFTGLIKSYFNDEIPDEFFEVFSYYMAYAALAALCDTSINTQDEPVVGLRHMENIINWFDNMTQPVPIWFLT